MFSYPPNPGMAPPPPQASNSSPQFQPRLGMGGTRMLAPQSNTPQGRASIQAAMGAQRMNAPINPNRQADPRGFADQGGVVAGQQQMPQGGELTQAQRDQMMANFGPQNAALAGYMGG